MAGKFLQKVRAKMEAKGTVGAFHEATGTPAGKPIPVAKTESKMVSAKADTTGSGDKKKMTPAALKTFREALFAKNAKEHKF